MSVTRAGAASLGRLMAATESRGPDHGEDGRHSHNQGPRLQPGRWAASVTLLIVVVLILLLRSDPLTFVAVTVGGLGLLLGLRSLWSFHQ